MQLKPGVHAKGLHPEILLAVLVAQSVWPGALTVTSLTDGVHKAGSKHYLGQAVDLRTNNLAGAQRDMLVPTLRTALGSDYDVILEDREGMNEHLHIEFDPEVA